MSGKMNWSRVRKDNLAQQHGSEWVETETRFPVPPSRPPEKGIIQEKQGGTGVIVVKPGNLTCTCGKSKGFAGDHGKNCPMRGKNSLRARKPTIPKPRTTAAKTPSVNNPVPRFSDEEFQRMMAGFRQDKQIAKWLRLALKQLARDASLQEPDRIATIARIQEVLKRL